MMKSVKKFSKWIAIAVVLAVAITLPLVLRSLGQRQEIRKKAAPATTLSFTPSNPTVITSGTVTLTSQLDPGPNQVTAVELHVAFDPALVHLTGITASSAFPVILQPPSIDNATGSASVTLGITPLNPVTTVVPVATFDFQAQGTPGMPQINYSSQTQASAINETGNIITSMTPGTITILTTGVTPTPSCIPRPACLDAFPRCLPPEPINGWCPPAITPTAAPTLPPPKCGYPAPPPDCRYVPGPNYNPDTNCGMVLSCPPTPTPTPTPEVWNFFLKFNGVPGGNAVGANVTIRFVNGAINLVTPHIPVTYNGNGIYQASIILNPSQLPPGPGYNIIVKGEKHIARKYCQFTGQTAPCSAGQSFTIPASFTSPSLTLDFTGLALDPGDLPPQDNKADASDFDKVKALMNKPCLSLTEGELTVGDLNYDGCVNSLDAFLMRKTLEIRYDDN